MSPEVKVDSVRSESSGTSGGRVSRGHGATLALDSVGAAPAGCLHQQRGLPGRRVVLRRDADRDARAGDGGAAHADGVTIEGSRDPAVPRYQSVHMRFEMAGVSQAQAEDLVKVYRKPLTALRNGRGRGRDHGRRRRRSVSDSLPHPQEDLR